ncbi:MAG: hypothetical protein HY903_15820 [Deltaproteobacteria bacterium]|nr:hypothetical protein [Deltaproteobacteria bacterium]
MASPASTEPLLRESRYEAPSIQLWLGLGLAAVIVWGLGRNALFGDSTPNGYVILTALLSVIALLLIGRRRDPVMTAARSGFHGGMFGFFLSMPILSMSGAEMSLSEATVDTVGWSLVLTVIGFEAGYWTRRPTAHRDDAEHCLFVLTYRQRRWLFNLMWIGVALWVFVLLDYAVAADVPLLSVMLTMRGEVEGARPGAEPALNTYIAGLLGSATYMSTACASALLTIPGPTSRSTRALAWTTLGLCAFAGWLRGSRAMFFYAFAPILTTEWPRLASTSMSRATRILVVAVALSVLALAWGGQSAMRGADIRKYEAGADGIGVDSYTQGALDIFAELGPIVEAFPALFPYQYGKSLIPLFLGWVPRPLWPGKPYSFSMFANFIKGETLEQRSASIAVGLTGEGYGQGGLIGVLVWGVLFGLACRWVDERLGRMPRHHPLRLQLAGICGIWAAMIVRGSPPEMFYMGLYAWLFVWLMARYLTRHCMVDPRALFDTPPQAAADSSSV